MKIGIQGVAGSFNEAAAKAFIAKHHIANAEISYLVSSEPVLAGLDKGSIDYGVIGIFNNRGGVVWESIEALAKYRCQIIDRISMLISQNLLTLPGQIFSDLTEIHSHVQALSQCREYIEKSLPHAKIIEAMDTAQAAQFLAIGKLPKTAAVIASKSCAALYNLQMLVTDIQDRFDNETTFVLLQRIA